MNALNNVFKNATINIERLQEIEAIKHPRSCYFIAMTPRSGSTYLCDVLHKIKRFGMPQEVLDPKPVEIRLPKIPARTPEEYLRNVLRVNQSDNGVSGIKASWFQFQNFKENLNDQKLLTEFKYIYLTRRDLAEQAVSLYKATETTVFHSAKTYNEEAFNQLKALDYDYHKIKYWYQHIVAQERGWQQYFYEQAIFPLCIYYEDLNTDILTLLKRIALYVGVQPNNVVLPMKSSAYIKIADDRNQLWARRFVLEDSGLSLKLAD